MGFGDLHPGVLNTETQTEKGLQAFFLPGGSTAPKLEVDPVFPRA